MHSFWLRAQYSQFSIRCFKIKVMKNILKNKQGQGMIELLVAIFVIVMGIVAVLSLSIVTITAGRESIMTVEASNLAREGLEVVRNIRDSNWLKIQAGELNSDRWDDGLFEGTDYDAVAQFDPTSGEWILDFDDLDYQLKRLSDGTYVFYDYSEGQLSAFSRRILTLPICDDYQVIALADNTSCQILSKNKIGIKVKSIISWQDKGKDRLTTAEEDLYDWRR